MPLAVQQVLTLTLIHSIEAIERYLEAFVIVWLLFAEMSVNESPVLRALLHLLFSIHCCNSLETHLLPHRFSGVRDGPVYIKADRKPGD